jgi:hypothetical protein
VRFVPRGGCSGPFERFDREFSGGSLRVRRNSAEQLPGRGWLGELGADCNHALVVVDVIGEPDHGTAPEQDLLGRSSLVQACAWISVRVIAHSMMPASTAWADSGTLGQRVAGRSSSPVRPVPARGRKSTLQLDLSGPVNQTNAVVALPDAVPQQAACQAVSALRQIAGRYDTARRVSVSCAVVPKASRPIWGLTGFERTTRASPFSDAASSRSGWWSPITATEAIGEPTGGSTGPAPGGSSPSPCTEPSWRTIRRWPITCSRRWSALRFRPRCTRRRGIT